jgi:hypothetical protein
VASGRRSRAAAPTTRGVLGLAVGLAGLASLGRSSRIVEGSKPASPPWPAARIRQVIRSATYSSCHDTPVGLHARIDDMLTAISVRIAHWKSVLAMPLVPIISGSYAVLGVLTWSRDELVRRNPSVSVWRIVDFLPHWSAWQWTSGALIVGMALILEGSYRRKKSAEANHGMAVGKLQREIRGAADEIEALRVRLREGPTVVLSNVANGINLRAASSSQDAINVRLVHIESSNYYLNSDVVRVLCVGLHETLILHCHPRKGGGSLVLQAFSSPTLFFNDLYPSPEGADSRAVMEHALTLLTERQLIVPIELAYSNLSGTQHYRSSFRLRWDRMQESIILIPAV